MDLDKIVGDVPEGLSQMEIARYIYIKLGQYFSYNEDYYMANTKQEKLNIFYTPINDITNDRAVCSQFSEMYSTLLQQYGIKCKEIFEKGRYVGHKFVEVNIDGKSYRTDLTHDLTQIKMGLRTHDFMMGIDDNSTKEYDTISETTLKKIDDKIGYTYKGMYMDDTLKMLSNDMHALRDPHSEYGAELRKTLGVDGYTNRQLMEYKIDFLKKYFSADKLHGRERADYFCMLLQNSATPSEFERFGLTTLTCADKDKNVMKFLNIHDRKSDDNLIYAFSDEDYARKVDSEFVKKSYVNGLRPISHDEKKMNALLRMANLLNDKDSKENNIEPNFSGMTKSTQDLGKEALAEINDVALEDETERAQRAHQKQLEAQKDVGKDL